MDFAVRTVTVRILGYGFGLVWSGRNYRFSLGRHIYNTRRERLEVFKDSMFSEETLTENNDVAELGEYGLKEGRNEEDGVCEITGLALVCKRVLLFLLVTCV